MPSDSCLLTRRASPKKLTKVCNCNHAIYNVVSEFLALRIYLFIYLSIIFFLISTTCVFRGSCVIYLSIIFLLACGAVALLTGASNLRLPAH
jgi:hypothetical protein